MNIKLEIPESFFQGEELCGYYVSPEMKKVWAVQLDLLAEFQRVCEKHNLKWWMDAGTLLGAVRHKGFIPWDHDVDAMMMRSDYERLCSIADKEFTSPYRLITPEKSQEPRYFPRLVNESTTMIDGWKRHLMEVQSPSIGKPVICLDVFPVDKVPDDERSVRKFIRKMKFMSLIIGKIWVWKDNYYPAKSLLKRPIKALMNYLLKHTSITFRKPFMKCIEAAKNYNNSDCKHVAKVCMFGDPDFMKRRIWPLSDFDDTVYFQFEMLTLPAPSGWEDILNHFYGNWHEYVIRKVNGKADPEAIFYNTEHPYTYYTQEGHPIDEDKD